MNHLLYGIIISGFVLGGVSCIETADCDENNSCEAGKVCFRSRPTGGGYCRKSCDPEVEVSGCGEGQICRGCNTLVGNLCLPASSDTDTASVCAPCQCDPVCPVGSGCLDAVCVEGAEGCQCADDAC